MKVGEISKKVQESRLKWNEHALRREEECWQESDGDGGAGKRRRGLQTKAEVAG